uniref:Transposase IS200-like domain-containing protein n=2 Tax=Desulfobacterium TaxID=2295 RepID=E1YGQ7_9BACT|nr:hypothetical protein N47_F14460 [uncultured Desulfobacterium sp.]
MSCPLRIEYPGAWYHVMNRGRRDEKIFADDADYAMFVELLEDASEMWKVNVAAYCLIPKYKNGTGFIRHLFSQFLQKTKKNG